MPMNAKSFGHPLAGLQELLLKQDKKVKSLMNLKDKNSGINKNKQKKSDKQQRQQVEL